MVILSSDETWVRAADLTREQAEVELRTQCVRCLANGDVQVEVQGGRGAFRDGQLSSSDDESFEGYLDGLLKYPNPNPD